MIKIDHWRTWHLFTPLDVPRAKNNSLAASYLTIKFPYNPRSDWLKQRALLENKEQVNDIKLAFKFLLWNFDKFDPNLTSHVGLRQNQYKRAICQQ